MKKIIKIIGIALLACLLLLLASPFLFKGSLEKLLMENINKNLNATVAWEDFDLSLMRNFPKATLVLKNFSIVNKAPFDGDTLASGKQLQLEMGLKQLLKGAEDAIQIDALSLDEAFINIQVNEAGKANYDISIKKPEDLNTKNQEALEESAGFVFDLTHYELTNSRVNYHDQSTNNYLSISQLNHEGTGDFSLATLQLDTQTTAIITYKTGDTEYFSNTALTLDALFDLDLENQKYSFLENQGKVNNLPLNFNGFVQINEKNTNLDLTFKTPSSDFKNFLAVLPKEYVKNLDGVTTTGNFSIDGQLKGIVDDTKIPTMDIKVRSKNASFKYESLPKAVENIAINVDLINTTGLATDTYLNIGGVTFKIDDEIFTASGNLKNFTQNMLVNLALNGTLDLANIEKVLPIDLDQDLTGIFKANVTTNFDMNAIDKEEYQNIKTNGTASITNFNYSDEAFQNPITIRNAAIRMSPGNIQLEDMNAMTGETDINAKGNIQNLIPWMMAKQDLKGHFTVTSDTFNVNDFMSSEPSNTKTSEDDKSLSTSEDSGIKIPDFLDATIDFTAKKVRYDDITLSNTKGTVSIKNEIANLTNVTSNILGGDIALQGNVSTKEATPTFAMELDLSKIDINQSFEKLPLLKFLAPIAKALQGTMDTKLNLSGNLSKELTPDLTTLGGTAFAQVVTAKVDASQAPLLSQLGQQLSFLNVDQLSLQNVGTNLTFNQGTIVVAPFDFEVEGVAITAGGSHGINQNMNYDIKMDVPARYLGSEVTSLLSKLDPQDAATMTVGLPIGLTGTFSNPKIKLNTQAALTDISNRILEKQKKALINEGADAIKDIINDTTGDDIGGTAGSILDGILKPKEDTNASDNNTQKETTDAVKDILGGLFGNKKKDSTGIKKGN
jgi:hypothetical protein